MAVILQFPSSEERNYRALSAAERAFCRASSQDRPGLPGVSVAGCRSSNLRQGWV